MRHFLIDIVYRVPLDTIAQYIPLHRVFLNEGYKRGVFLYSGPKIPKTGGIILARDVSVISILNLCKQDPLFSFADYSVTEFEPLWYQVCLTKWIKDHELDI